MSDAIAPGPVTGLKIGRYTVVEKIARGGMAEIFLAETADLPGVRRTVALKRMLVELTRDDAYAAQFLDEAKILASLSHPNIVQIVEVGQDGGDLFIAMEHVDGVSLSELMAASLRRGERLPLDHVVQVMGGALGGLHYLHEKTDARGRALNLVHRDLSPRNVLVSREGAVKLIDFGITRPANRLGGDQANRVKGTVPYMSPEQCRGRMLDRRSDVFSAGILLFELTVGRRLFSGENDEAVLEQIVNGRVPRPRSIDPSYPEPLEDVVLRALALQPVDRYPSASALHDALDHASNELGLKPSVRALQASLRSWLPEREVSAARGTALETSRTRTVEATAPDVAAFSAPVLTNGVPEPWPVAPKLERGAKPVRAEARRSSGAALGLVVACAVGAVMWNVSRTNEAEHPAISPETKAVATTTTASARTASSALPVKIEVARGAPVTPTHEPSRPAAPHRRATEPAGSKVTDAGAPAEPAMPREGSLVIESRPWADVKIDGEERGPTPILASLPAGLHTLELRRADLHLTKTATIVVERGKTVRRRFELAPGR